jgi:hypothetical protein
VASTVALPRWVVGLLVAACVACLVAVAFLLGRLTAPARPAASAGFDLAGEPTTARVPDDAPRAAIESAPHEGAPEGPADAPATASAGAGLAGVGAPDAAAVADYFRQMEGIAAEARASQDPQALARTVLEQAMSGNMDGIDGMIASQRALEARLKQLVPPPACREHHQRSLRLFGRAIALLETTRDAMTGQGAANLAGMAAEGREIELEARALDTLANDLRRAAGLAPLS